MYISIEIFCTPDTGFKTGQVQHPMPTLPSLLTIEENYLLAHWIKSNIHIIPGASLAVNSKINKGPFIYCWYTVYISACNMLSAQLD